MKKGLLLSIGLFFASLLFSPSLFADKTKQALRAFDREDYDRVEDILLKSMEDDSLNPATEYVWALLYSAENYPRYHIDTAHFYIQLACQHLLLQNEDHLDELDDADLSEIDIKNKKIAIDSTAFGIADSLNTIPAYNHFIELYQDAADLEEAVARRNQLVYAEVEATHTWEAYDQFLKNYPAAAQRQKAQIQYDKLIYEEKAKTERVEELEQFLVDEPQTPYRHSLEKKIFEDYIQALDPDRMMAFLDRYSNPLLARRMLNALYHLEEFDLAQYAAIAQQIQPNFSDSVRQLEQLNQIPLVVTLTDDRYQFLDMNGKQVIPISFDNVRTDYRCGGILDDLLEVTLEQEPVLINRNGEVILKGFTGSVVHLGAGLMAVTENKKVGLMHKSGFRLLGAQYDALDLVKNKLLIFKKEDKYGLMGITGKIYVKALFDNIEPKGSFLIFEKNERFGISNIKEMMSEQPSDFEIQCRFEEVELINEHYIIGFDAESETLINNDLQEKSPANTKRINTRYDTWVLELEEGFQTYDPKLGQLSSGNYQDVLQNAEWLGLVRNGKWLVYYKGLSDEPVVGIDSLKLLGEDIAILFRGESGMAIFPNKKIVQIVEGQYLKSIGPKIQSDRHFLVIKNNGENILYQDGVKQFSVVCDELGYISDSSFYVKKNGNYGAVGLDGRPIMRIRYDAISQAEEEVAAVLYNGKFGAYNFRDRILLRIDYQEKIKAYDRNLFLINDNGKYGLLDRFNHLRVTPDYDQIAHWSDSIFLGQKEGAWSLIRMSDREAVLTDIQYYEWIKHTTTEKIMLVRIDGRFGVFHSAKGLIIPPVFHDVINLGHDDIQYYFTETYVEAADIFVVVYYNSDGVKISSAAYRSDTYERIICEN